MPEVFKNISKALPFQARLQMFQGIKVGSVLRLWGTLRWRGLGKNPASLGYDYRRRTRFQSFLLPFSSAAENCSSPGLFGIPNLHQVSDWKKITEDVIADCDNVRQRIYSKRKKPDMSILDDLDYLSYSICEIADAAELCRCVHVDFEHRRAAEETVFRFSDYMLLLGHDKKMYDALCSLTQDRVLYEAMDDEQVMMVKDMKNEFERDGVHLDEDVRAQLRKISSEITSLEADFQKNSMQIGGSFAVPADAIRLLPQEMYAQATNEKHRSSGFKSKLSLSTVLLPVPLFPKIT